MAFRAFALSFLIVSCSTSFNRTAAEESSTAWIDLLLQVDPQRHAVAGDWKKTADGLMTDAVAGSRITLPSQPGAEYDFRVAFTRTSGVHSIALIFAVGSRQATFEVDAWGQHLAGLQLIAGRTMQDNPTRVENQTLQNGRRYTMLVQVRRDSIRAFLDDNLRAEHKTDARIRVCRVSGECPTPANWDSEPTRRPRSFTPLKCVQWAEPVWRCRTYPLAIALRHQPRAARSRPM